MASSVGDSTAAASDGGGGGGGVAAPAPPEAAGKGSATISVTVVLLVLLVASVAALLMSPQPGGGKPRVEEGVSGSGSDGSGSGGERVKGAEPVEQAVGPGAAAIPGFNSRLDAFRTWAKLTWLKLRRPHSGEPRYDDAGSSCSAADAAKKSLEMTKETVEEAAASAARAAGDAVGKARDKVKGAASPAQRAPSDGGVLSSGSEDTLRKHPQRLNLHPLFF